MASSKYVVHLLTLTWLLHVCSQLEVVLITASLSISILLFSPLLTAGCPDLAACWDYCVWTLNTVSDMHRIRASFHSYNNISTVVRRNGGLTHKPAHFTFIRGSKGPLASLSYLLSCRHRQMLHKISILPYQSVFSDLCPGRGVQGARERLTESFHHTFPYDICLCGYTFTFHRGTLRE